MTGLTQNKALYPFINSLAEFPVDRLTSKYALHFLLCQSLNGKKLKKLDKLTRQLVNPLTRNSANAFLLRT